MMCSILFDIFDGALSQVLSDPKSRQALEVGKNFGATTDSVSCFIHWIRFRKPWISEDFPMGKFFHHG